MIRILYFASLREKLSRSSEELDLPSGVSTIDDLLTLLRDRGGDWAETLSDGASVLFAVNQEMVKADTPLGDGDEVGIFPPVTGG